MTAHKHFKQLVRVRMDKTGESYTTARRQLLQKNHAPAKKAVPWHFPGSVPAATALRELLAHAGVVDPHAKQPFSEAMIFGLAGGIGIGVCSFFYEKADVASFCVAGRHFWQDDLAYVRQLCQRLGLKPVVFESSGTKGAEAALPRTLAEHGPCIAWVDMANLPHRAMPAKWSGGGYHVITVYSVDADAGTALIGDLTDAPITIPLPDLTRARGRIKKFKHRLLSLPKAKAAPDLPRLVREGLRASHASLSGDNAPKNCRTPFCLDAIRQWGERLHGSKEKESWDRVFTPGGRLWQGLWSINVFIEHYGTGGGLQRPIFADFLNEAGAALKDAELKALATHYAELGRAWSELADAALPNDVPLFRRAKELHARRTELTNSGGSPDQVRDLWDQLDDLEQQVRDKFPLTPDECAELRAGLQAKVLTLHEGEVAALNELAKLI